MRESRRKSEGDNAAEAADLLEELTDEWEALEDLRDPRPQWRRSLSKTWEVTKSVAGFAVILGIGWVIYDQYPESRGVMKVLAVIVVGLTLWPCGEQSAERDADVAVGESAASAI